MIGDIPQPWLLAIDTATDQAGIALFDGERLGERSWSGGRQQTITVLPEIEQLCRQMRITLADVAAIAVSIGPGSFTGLRVGLGVAKGVVLAGDSVLIGVPTLEIAAAPWRVAGVAALVVAPAGRSRVVWATTDGSGLSEPRNTGLDEVLAQVEANPDRLVSGELSAAQRALVLEHGGNLAPVVAGYRRPGTLAEIGYDRWRRGAVDDPVLLEPAYLHGRPNPRPPAR